MSPKKLISFILGLSEILGGSILSDWSAAEIVSKGAAQATDLGKPASFDTRSTLFRVLRMLARNSHLKFWTHPFIFGFLTFHRWSYNKPAIKSPVVQKK